MKKYFVFEETDFKNLSEDANSNWNVKWKFQDENRPLKNWEKWQVERVEEPDETSRTKHTTTPQNSAFQVLNEFESDFEIL